MTQHKLFRPSGSKVTIYDNNGSLLLRFTYKGKPYNISLGLENTKKNLNIAEKKAIQITQDIIFNTFQEDKYSPVRKKIDINTNYLTSIPEVLNFYMQLQPDLDSSTKESLQILKEWLNLSPPEFKDLKNLNRFFIYLKSEVKHKNSEKVGYSDKFIASHLRILRSAINLAFKYKKLENKTDITDLISTLNTKNTKEIKVYSKEEIQLIINEAYSFFSYFIYGAFIEFRFLTGARSSEVVALTWKNLIQDENRVFLNFESRVTDGILKKGLKKGTDFRLFPVNEQLLNLLNKIPKFNHLIFPSPTGIYINTNNFAKRKWKPLIEKLLEEKKIKFYIPFYDTRHCFGSHVCRQTTDLKTVSYLMGNSPDTLQKYYLSVDSTFEVPEF